MSDDRKREQILTIQRWLILVAGAVLLAILILLFTYPEVPLFNGTLVPTETPTIPVVTPPITSPRPVTVIVAATDSRDAEKQKADLVCDGINDHLEIREALERAGPDHAVQLSGGTYHCAGPLSLSGDRALYGAGEGATILDFLSISGISLKGGGLNHLAMLDITGSGYVYIASSNNFIEYVTVRDVDASYISCFQMVCEPGMKEISGNYFDHCQAINPDRWGFSNHGAGQVIRDCTWSNCSAINCGRFAQFSDHTPISKEGWDVGFDITESAEVKNLLYTGCIAEGCWESGFHAEYLPAKENVRLVNCISRNNGQKEKQGAGDCTWGAGYLLSEGIYLENCLSEENSIGYSFHTGGGSSITECQDKRSNIGIRIHRIADSPGIRIQSCTIEGADVPILIEEKESRNVLIEDIHISAGEAPRNNAAIQIKADVWHPGEILISNSTIDGYEVGIYNYGLEKVRVENVIVTGSQTGFINCEIVNYGLTEGEY